LGIPSLSIVQLCALVTEEVESNATVNTTTNTTEETLDSKLLFIAAGIF